MLLKYGMSLQNDDQSLEAKEVYIFLLKFDGKIKQTAQRLLASMSKNGSMKPLLERVNTMNFDHLNFRLNRSINLGSRLEKLLNRLGQKFTFEVMKAEITSEILDLSYEMSIIIQEEKEWYANELSDSFHELRKREQMLNETDLYMGYTMDELVFYINQQIFMMERKQKQEKWKSILCGVASCFIPGIPWTKSVGYAVKTTAHGLVQHALHEAECTELKFLDFLLEFSGAFSQLGTDIALLRTKEDFQTFDFGGIKRFLDADVFKMLKSEDFYIDTACLLGTSKKHYISDKQTHSQIKVNLNFHKKSGTRLKFINISSFAANGITSFN